MICGQQSARPSSEDITGKKWTKDTETWKHLAHTYHWIILRLKNSKAETGPSRSVDNNVTIQPSGLDTGTV